MEPKVVFMYGGLALAIVTFLLYLVYRYDPKYLAQGHNEHQSWFPVIDFNDPQLAMACQQCFAEEVAYRDAVKGNVFAAHFSAHADHQKTWLRDEYFDAMFVSETYRCSCGSELTITRAMVEAVPEAALPPKPGSNTIKPGASIPLL